MEAREGSMEEQNVIAAVNLCTYQVYVVFEKSYMQTILVDQDSLCGNLVRKICTNLFAAKR